MPTPLRVLILEDQPTDAELTVRELHRAGFAPDWQRVESERAFVAALDAPCVLILSDYRLPGFTALQALRHVRERRLDTPVIVLTGTLGDEEAV
ncbi:MAG: response regulator, partial [Nitrospirota bacterium]|nr:response regulator [Nitrospirota bacterium]